MSITQLRRDLQGIKETVKTKPIEVLLNSDPRTLTDDELDIVIQTLILRLAPTNILLTAFNREHGTDIKSIDDVPEGYFSKMANGELE